jgi:saccharopine dehydrogenase (NAD+, L-lysine forming)
MNLIGFRREDKSPHERRIPLVPEDLRAIRSEHGARFVVQRSPQRAIPDADFEAAGIEVRDDIDEADVVMGVKEVPVEAVQSGKTYIFFSHTIKGQAYNMHLLRALMERGCTLIDYERIVNEAGQRLVAFGRHAGLAGAIDGLWTLGQAWRRRKIRTPLRQLKLAHAYGHSDVAKAAIAEIAAHCLRDETFQQHRAVIGVTGGGRVARGAHEIIDALSPDELAPEQIHDAKPGRFSRVRFDESHFAERRDGAPFELAHYYAEPEAYQGIFEERYAGRLDLLVNGIYWEPRFPRLVSRTGIRSHYLRPKPRLAAIADISCDIAGSVELTVKATTPDDPVYTWDTKTDRAQRPGKGHGPLMMTVDILPTELPVEASEAFSTALRPLLPDLIRHDFRQGIDGLCPELRRAAIVDRGRLTPDYAQLMGPLEAETGSFPRG